ERGQVHQLRSGVGDRLDDRGPGVVGECGLPGVKVPGVHEGAAHPGVGERVVEQLGGAPYSRVEATTWPPGAASANSAMVVAACPEATAIAPVPRSRALMRCSSTEVVGLPDRE